MGTNDIPQQNKKALIQMFVSIQACHEIKWF